MTTKQVEFKGDSDFGLDKLLTLAVYEMRKDLKSNYLRIKETYIKISAKILQNTFKNVTSHIGLCNISA